MPKIQLPGEEPQPGVETATEAQQGDLSVGDQVTSEFPGGQKIPVNSESNAGGTPVELAGAPRQPVAPPAPPTAPPVMPQTEVAGEPAPVAEAQGQGLPISEVPSPAPFKPAQVPQTEVAAPPFQQEATSQETPAPFGAATASAAEAAQEHLGDELEAAGVEHPAGEEAPDAQAMAVPPPPTVSPAAAPEISAVGLTPTPRTAAEVPPPVVTTTNPEPQAPISPPEAPPAISGAQVPETAVESPEENPIGAIYEDLPDDQLNRLLAATNSLYSTIKNTLTHGDKLSNDRFVHLTEESLILSDRRDEIEKVLKKRGLPIPNLEGGPQAQGSKVG